MIYRVKKECLHLLELFVIPSISIFLPWSISIKLYSIIAKIPFLYNEGMGSIIKNAKLLGLIQNEPEWIVACKISRIVDSADVFLCMFRGKKYCDKYVKHNFTEQILNQNIIFFPHFGTGLFLYKYLALKGIKSNLLINPVPTNFSLINLSYKFRIFVLKYFCNTKVITPSSMLEIRKVLKNKENILVSPDMPRLLGVSSYNPVTSMGKLNLTSGFFDLAASRKLDVINVILGYNVNTGQREFDADFLNNMIAISYAENFAEKTIKSIEYRPYLWRMLIIASEVLFKK